MEPWLSIAREGYTVHVSKHDSGEQWFCYRLGDCTPNFSDPGELVTYMSALLKVPASQSEPVAPPPELPPAPKFTLAVILGYDIGFGPQSATIGVIEESDPIKAQEQGESLGRAYFDSKFTVKRPGSAPETLFLGVQLRPIDKNEVIKLS